MGCTQSKRTGLLFDKEDTEACNVSEDECNEQLKAVAAAMHVNKILDSSSCKEDMTWDLLLARQGIYITSPDLTRDRCLFVVTRTNLIAHGVKPKGCCAPQSLEPKFGHVLRIKNVRCPQASTLEIDMADPPPTGLQLEKKMIVQHPDIDAIVTALRVSLAHAYYGTPPDMVPFSMALPKSLYKPLPPIDPAAHQAGGLRSVFLASWSQGCRAIYGDGPANARSTQERMNAGDFTSGEPRHGAIDPFYLGSSHRSCMVAIVRALRFNTFFSHLDLSPLNFSAPRAWNGFPPSDNEEAERGVFKSPLSMALQELLGWNVTLQSLVARELPRGEATPGQSRPISPGGGTLLDWEAIGSALLVNPRPMIATWDLTNCGIGDAGLRALLPAWWRIFSFTAPAREIRLSGNWLGGAGLAPFFNMLNGTGFAINAPAGLPIPPGPLSAPNMAFLTCLELGGCDLQGAFPSLAYLLSRCPFLNRLDLSNPLPSRGVSLGPQEAAMVFGALVNSLCPLEELDMRGCWSLATHMTPDAGAPLAEFLLRKHTLSRVWLGELKYDDARVNELDAPVAAAAVTTFGGVMTAGGKRKGQTVDLSGSSLLSWFPTGPIVPGGLILRECRVSPAWYQGLLAYCSVPHSALRRLDIGSSFFLLGPDEKMALAASLGNLITFSPLEALVMPGDRNNSEKCNVFEVGQMAIILQAVTGAKSLLELDVAGHDMGDVGAAALGAALRKNRSITSLSYDRNSIELEGFKAVRGCLYGNKKLVNVSPPVEDYERRASLLDREVAAGQQRMHEIKRRIKAAYKHNKPLFRQEIQNIAANNKGWKAFAREKAKLTQIIADIATSVASNRELKAAKDAEKAAAKMEKQKEAVEQRYAKKMDTILTQLAKETEKARRQAASTRTSPFKSRPRSFYYTKNARRRQKWERTNNQRHNAGDGMYFSTCPPMTRSPYHDGSDRYQPEDDDLVDCSATHSEGGLASICPEEEPVVDVHDDYVLNEGGPSSSTDEASNPLDGVRNLILQNGAGVFNSENLGQIDDLFREAGTGVYGRVGPILGEAQTMASDMTNTATSWGTDLGGIVGDIGESSSGFFGGLGGFFSDVGDALGSAVDVVGNVAGDAANAIGDAAGGALDAIGDVAGDVGDVIGDAAGDVGDVIGDVAGDAADVIGDVAGDAVDAIGDVAGDVGDVIGDVVGDAADVIGDVAGDAVDAIGDVAGDVGDVVGDVVGDAADVIGDVAGDAVDAIGDVAGDVVDLAGDAAGNAVDAIGDAAGDAADFAGDAAGGVLDVVGDVAGTAVEAAGDLAGDVGETMGYPAFAAIEAAREAEDASGADDEDELDVADDVDMYAGAGPMDLDDGGPTGGGATPKVLSGPRRLVKAFSHETCSGDSTSGDVAQSLLGVGEWTAARLKSREESRLSKRLLAEAVQISRPEAFPYKTELHAFHAGRVRPSPESRVTLVTQCSADRLATVLKQAVRWGGDVSLAVLVPSAPSSATAKTLSGIHKLCSAIDRAHSANPLQEGLSLDVAVLEGAEADPARHDHCGALYPVNTLRNLALLQARDDEFHSAQTVFLVDSDCVPSEHLLAELSSPGLQHKLSGGDDAMRSEGSPAAIVVPCLEFAPGFPPTEDVQAPSKAEEVAGMLQEGRVQGFHVDYFPKGHGPTDFDRWAAAALVENAEEALAYTVPYSSCFEPYIVVNKSTVPMYDERFRGYGMNKVAHLLSVATGSPALGSTSAAVNPAEFVVLRKAFVFALPHPRSEDWEITYGIDGDPYRRMQVKALWSTFQRELSDGLSPVVSYPTSAIADSLVVAPKHVLPPSSPPYRVFQPPLAVAPGHYELPDETCFSPARSFGGHTPCVEEESDEAPPQKNERDTTHPMSCVVERPDETPVLSLRPGEGEQSGRKMHVARHLTPCLAGEPDETSALLSPEIKDAQPQEKTTASVAKHPTPAPLSSAMGVAPVAGFGRVSYPDLEIELKAKPIFVDQIGLKRTSALVEHFELKTKPAAFVKVEAKAQSEIALRALEPKGP